VSAEAHPLSPGSATLVLVVLLVLVGATIGAAFIDLGPLNLAVTLAIAAVKTFLVMAFFMHLWKSHRLTWFVAVFGFGFLAMLIGSILIDFALR
jgi:cytochrome c oxidase subunit IV